MAEIIQRSFAAGELAPSIRSRADLAKYTSGLALCENMLVKPQGGVYNRPGTRFSGEVGDSTGTGRLIPFQFNTTQSYILVFQEYTLRIVKDGAFILDGGGPAIYELATPYAAADLPRLAFTQSADVMTIVHHNHDPMDLSRLAEDNWSLDAVDFTPPLTPPTIVGSLVVGISNITQANPAVVTIDTAYSYPYGFFTGNTVTLTGISGMTELNNRNFTITYISPTQFSLDDEDSTGHTAYTSGGTATKAQYATTIGSGGGSYTKTYSYVVTAVDEDGNESLPSSEVTVTARSLSVTFGVRLQWNAVPGAAYYRVYKDPSVNTSIHGWIGDSNETTFDDYNKAPVTTDAPPENRTPFAGANNKPAAVNYYQQRRVFANTINEPQAVFATQTGKFNSLRTSTPARDDDAITMTIVGKQVNEIRHITAISNLVLLTAGSENIVTEGQDEVWTPATAGSKPQSFNGASWVTPVVVNDTLIYLQEKGSKLRDLNYEFTNDKYRGNDLSIMAEHLFDGYQITEMAYAAEPDSIIWCVRDDGRMLGLTYQREHQVWAWHQHVTDGAIESIAVISENGRDALYMLVNRTIDGNTVRYIERMEPRESTNPEDAFYVDCGLSYDGAATDTITGLDHLEGETISVLADGNEVKNLVVTSGSITLPQAASKVHAGLGYTSAIELLDIDTPSLMESFKSLYVSVSSVVIEFLKSRGGWVGPKLDDGTTGTMREIKPRFDSDSYSTMTLKTYKAEISIEPEWGRGGGIRIEQRSPLPFAITSVTPNVDASR